MIFRFGRDTGEILIMMQSGVFVFEGQVHGKDEMDVLLVTGINAAAGYTERKQLIRGMDKQF